MAQNIEIKAHVVNWDRTQQLAQDLAGTRAVQIHQLDTFYTCSRGRLKLRVIDGRFGQLIHYIRPDQEGPKSSQYEIYHSNSPETLDVLLAASNGRLGVVEKTRHLYLVGPTRIHLDDVVGLGRFMELEVVISDGLTPASGAEIAKDLMQKLGIQPSELVEGAYFDLLPPS